MNFFIVANGRSGTTWLASTLNQSPTHTVAHEEADRHGARAPDYYEPFPVARWRRGNYGEVHGKLRRYLSPDHAGPEMAIPGRYVLFRNRFEIVSSWMNRPNRLSHDIGWITRQICVIEKSFADLVRCRGFKPLWLHDLTGDLTALQSLIDDLRLGFKATPAMQARRMNATTGDRYQWDDEAMAIYEHVSQKFGCRELPG